MKQKCSLFLAVMIALSLAACGSRAAAPAEPDPAPPASESVPVPESSSAPEASPAPAAPSQPEPAALEITAADGVEWTTLLTWKPGTLDVSIPLPARDGRLLVETSERGEEGGKLLGFNLEHGVQEAMFPFYQEDKEVRQVLYGGEWAIKGFSRRGYQHSLLNHAVGGYDLPPQLQEGRRLYVSGYDWDAIPERDLLTWTDPDGLWLANADGSDPRLLLAAGELVQPMQEHGSEVSEDLVGKDVPEEKRLTFLSPRLINSGRTIAADFGQLGSQMGHSGLAVVDIATSKADWYFEYGVMTAADHEYLDDTHILMGNTLIDVTTGETERAWQWTLTERCPIYSGDFVHYFGSEDREDGSFDLVACTLEDWQTAEPVLTASGCEHFYPFRHSAADARHVVCRYETAGEEGLVLVTLPEGPNA